MAKNNHERGKGLAIGAAIGAVAGVVTGILFAPKSGKETREDIKVAARKAKEKFLAEATPKKTIFVPGKLINLII